MFYKSRAITIYIFLMIFLNSSSIYCQWIKQPFPSTEFLWQVDFCTEDTGWVAGHNFVYKTEDAGETWIAQDSIYGYFSSLYALNGKVAFLSSYEDLSLKMTTDGGLNWNKVDDAPYRYSEINFINDQIGFAGCYDDTSKAIFRRTFDGGYNWETLAYDFAPSDHEITGISFIDENTGWAVTYDSYVFKTEDGGDSWTFQGRIGYDTVYDYYTHIKDIDFISADSGWAVGGLSGRMAIVRTNDGGKTWIDSTYSGNSLREIEFINNRVGWFVGKGYSPFIGKSVNGGLTWEEQDLDPDLVGCGEGFESICMINEQKGWAAGNYLYYTNNGGVVKIDRRIELDPTQFILEQNYPNPFNSNTSISFNLPYNGHLILKIYNINGEEVDTIINKNLRSGFHKINWCSKELPSVMSHL